MFELLLQTKLYTPAQRSQLVQRPRLIEKLDGGLNRTLTLISAPAGFGKTTLVVNWLLQGKRPFSWLSLDEDDNDPIRFFTYMAAAVQQIDGVEQSIQALLQSGQPIPVKVLATALINDILAVSKPFVLVLDDYHVISETAVSEAVTFLLDNMPPPMRLIITSRSDPLLPLSRLRARGQLTELRTDDLRFSPEEASDFMQKAMGLTLSAEDVKALESRTEGWIAGLQMAALSIQGYNDEAEISEFIADFSGSNRYIFDYLTDEVLQQQPPEIQTFLLQTSLLDRLNASLCTAVTGDESSQNILEKLESTNLFLFPLDDKREWFRYHHLFAELLRHRLRRRQPEPIPTLYLRASQWYAQEGKVETAVQYALAGEDHVEASRLLNEEALDFVRRSEVWRLLKIAEKLPTATQKRFLRLCLAQSWCYVFIGKLDKAEEYNNYWTETLMESEVELPDSFPIGLAQAHHVTIRAYIATRRGKLQQAITFSEQALEKLKDLPDAVTGSLRGSILINLGQTQAALNDVDGAEQSYREAVDVNQENGRIFGVMAACSNLMVLLQRRGQLVSAKTVGQQGLNWLDAQQQQTRQKYPAEGEIRRELANIYYEQNQLSEARIAAERTSSLYRYANPMGDAHSQHLLFMIALAEENLEDAIRIYREIEPTIEQFPPIFRRYHFTLRLERMSRLAAAQPEVTDWVDALRHWQTGAETQSAPSILTNQESELLVQARLQRTLDQFDAALTTLNQVAEKLEAAACFGNLIACRVQQALVLEQVGKRETAVSHLNQAINLAAKFGYVRTFLDEGDGIRSLLLHLPASPYRNKLIQLFSQETPQSTVAPSQAAPEPLVTFDPLSKREYDVLRLLATHMPGPEIASQLHISPNTLKTHIRNIYNKLGVNGRHEAVVKAQSANLL